MSVKLTLFVSVLCVITLLSHVKCNDIHLGYVTSESKKIFSGVKEASPALWKRSEDVTVTTPAGEVISAVLVTDMRDDKDGEAYVTSGGIGQNTITIEIKSPSVLRGYKFSIEVYSSIPRNRIYTKSNYNNDNEDTLHARKF